MSPIDILPFYSLQIVSIRIFAEKRCIAEASIANKVLQIYLQTAADEKIEVSLKIKQELYDSQLKKIYSYGDT